MLGVNDPQIVLAYVLALLLPDNIIALATAMFMGLCAAAFLPLFRVRDLLKEPTHEGSSC